MEISKKLLKKDLNKKTYSLKLAKISTLKLHFC